MFDRRKVKVTSHMVGAAVEKHPALAKEIVQRGHEPAGHGQTWTPQYSMNSEQERRATRTRPQPSSESQACGQSASMRSGFAVRRTRSRSCRSWLHLLHRRCQRDEPFLVNVRNKPLAVVPYTLHMNDIVNHEGRYFSADAYAGDLKREFDVLYEEGEHRRRMMSVSAHDRIAGRPARMRVLEDFIQYAQSHPAVTFMRKVDIANYAIASTRTVREGFRSYSMSDHTMSGSPVIS